MKGIFNVLILFDNKILFLREIRDIISTLVPLEFEADYKLQAFFLLACPEKHYSLLLKCVSLPFILIKVEQKLRDVKILEQEVLFQTS